ncbi:MAG: 16S rRNA (guanine(966)-N(2))-methyltransferase RsmD [Sphingomonadales bacterium]
MRIIAGKYRGRRLQSPDDRSIRPSSDRLRESLFNLLAHRPQQPLADARVADVFAGSGALGFEALSRGAKAVTFLDTDPAARRLLAANARLLGATEACRVIAADARHPPPADQPHDLIFMDPPYRQGLAAAALPALIRQRWVGPASWVVIERAAGDPSEQIDWPGEQETRQIGKSELLILHDYR